MNDFLVLLFCAVVLAVSFWLMVKSYCRHQFNADRYCISCGKSLRELLQGRLYEDRNL